MYVLHNRAMYVSFLKLMPIELRWPLFNVLRLFAKYLQLLNAICFLLPWKFTVCELSQGLTFCRASDALQVFQQLQLSGLF